MPAASLGHNAALSFVVRGISETISSGSWILTSGFSSFGLRPETLLFVEALG